MTQPTPAQSLEKARGISPARCFFHLDGKLMDSSMGAIELPPKILANYLNDRAELAGALVAAAEHMAELEKPSFDDLMTKAYEICETSHLESVDHDQWWRFKISCEHGIYISRSKGPLQATDALRRAVDSSVSAHRAIRAGGDSAK